LIPSASGLQFELGREQGICLERLALEKSSGYSLDRVRDHYRQLLASAPAGSGTAETLGLAARVEKQAWMQLWRQESDPDRRRQVAIEEKALLQLALDGYLRGFRRDPAHYYSGINALTLMHLQVHLGLRDPADPQLGTLTGAVRFGAEAACGEPDPFWALATLADLEVLSGTAEAAIEAYRTACARHDSNRFALESCRDQLQSLLDLEFRPQVLAPAIDTLDRVIHRLAPDHANRPDNWEPRQAILFSGHRMDEPGRATPRFPPELEPAATARIQAALDHLQADNRDIAYCQAASGGDLIFLEAAVARGVSCQVLLPFDEPIFLQQSVLSSLNGQQWLERFYALKETLSLPIRVMPEALGPTPEQVNAYERCNRWQLYSALACGISKLRFITLWNGAGGDGPGGTAHLMRQVQRRTGRVEWIDIRNLTPAAPQGPSGAATRSAADGGE
jgi:hypothetical protein